MEQAGKLERVRRWVRALPLRAVWFDLTNKPAQILIGSFALLILLGTALLSLPWACRQGSLSWVNALFTATSATCVTGLVVVDTGKDLSVFGQVVVLALIQIGGLGIMTLTTFGAIVLGRNIGLRTEFAVRELVGEQWGRTALRLLRFIVLTTAVVEAAGAVALAWAFHRDGLPWGRAICHGVFHSISAFCNAGFALYSDSLCSVSAGPAIPLIVSALIILGGLGFSVLYSLQSVVFRGTRLSFHAHLVLGITVALVLGGTAALLAFEDGNPVWLSQSEGQRILHAFFQSVTTRTAGFNSVDLTHLTRPSLTLMMALMFIGAAPGSTGGGVKVTTVLVLYAVVASVMHGRDEVVLRKRRIDFDTVAGAVALVVLGVVLTGACVAVLVRTESLPATRLAFEAISAFGTVGLSLGITPQLSMWGKLCIVLLMFVGRVGLLSFLVLARPSRRTKLRHPTAELMIG